MPYVPAAKRIRANRVLARGMRRYKSRGTTFPRVDFSKPELKVQDKSIVSINPAFDVALVYSVMEPPQGTSNSAMIGRRAQIKSLFVRYNIRLLMGVAGASIFTNIPESVRFLAVYDADPDGAVPLVSDILQTGLISAPLKIENIERFKILIDRHHDMGVFNIDTARVYAVGTPVVHGKEYRKLNLPFEGPSLSGITGIKTGAIYCFFISSGGDATSTAVCDFYCRTRFTDQ